MKKQNKQGLTLVELMVVVIIVGNLAAVAVPLMSANKDRAIASEAVAALGSMNSAARVWGVATGGDVTNATPAGLIAAGYLTATDLEGTYFSSATMQAATIVNGKFALVTQTDKQGNTHNIYWDTGENTYISKK